jgi:hypothetical protein
MKNKISEKFVNIKSFSRQTKNLIYKKVAAVWITEQRIIVYTAEDCCKLIVTLQIALFITERNMYLIVK